MDAPIKNSSDPRYTQADQQSTARDELRAVSRAWMQEATSSRYCYHFEWLGRPIIQYPQDIVAMQTIIFAVKPDLIIETGIAHGGSLILSASLLELNAMCGGPADAHVVGVDIDIRAHNRQAIEAHPMFARISMIQGSSVAPEVIHAVKALASGKQKVLVCLDSNHTHDHVLAELEAYAPLTSAGSYCVVFDTIIEDMPHHMYPDRPWSVGNNPKTAVAEYLGRHPEFQRDLEMDERLLISAVPNGFLRRIM